MDKQKINKVSKAFFLGLAFGVGVVSLLLAIYYFKQDFLANSIETKNLFYLITGVSCLYLGLRFKN